MFHDEERERLLGGTVGVVEGIVLILDQLHVTGNDLGAFLGRGVDRQFLALPVFGKMEVLGGDKAGSLRDKCLCVFGLVEIEKQFVTCGFAESLVLLAVFLQHIVGQGGYRLVGGVLKYRMVGMLGGQYLCQPLRGGQT